MSLRAVCPVRTLALRVGARDVGMYCNEIKLKTVSWLLIAQDSFRPVCSTLVHINEEP